MTGLPVPDPAGYNVRAMTARTLHRTSRLLLAVLLAAAVTTPGMARELGETVTVQGQVVDAEGRPVPDLRVVLEGTRAYFSITRLRKAERGERQVATTTDDQGEFSLEWTWDRFFNKLRLRAGVPVQTADGEDFHVLDEVDVTRRFQGTGPVVATLRIDDTAYLDAFRRFLSTLDTDDERRLYRKLGSPDEVKVIEHPDRTETAWWYFALGKVYRFRDGQLHGDESFDPVERF